MKQLRRAFTDFLRQDTGATYSIEAIMVFPLMLWGYLGLFIFFDSFKHKSISVKAAYTISDFLSREMDRIDQPYVDGLNSVLDFLSKSRQPTYLRITVVKFDEDNEEHDLVWSAGGRELAGLTESEMRTQLSPKIPIMADADTAVVLQTWSSYDPIADVGIPRQSFEHLVVTSPRFVPQLLWVETRPERTRRNR